MKGPREGLMCTITIIIVNVLVYNVSFQSSHNRGITECKQEAARSVVTFLSQTALYLNFDEILINNHTKLPKFIQ